MVGLSPFKIIAVVHFGVMSGQNSELSANQNAKWSGYLQPERAAEITGQK